MYSPLKFLASTRWDFIQSIKWKVFLITSIWVFKRQCSSINFVQWNVMKICFRNASLQMPESPSRSHNSTVPVRSGAVGSRNGVALLMATVLPAET